MSAGHTGSRAGTLRQLECCVCGSDAGRHHQHWNRDTGYGICRKCVDWLLTRGTSAEEMRDLYGVEGVNYASATPTDPASKVETKGKTVTEMVHGEIDELMKLKVFTPGRARKLKDRNSSGPFLSSVTPGVTPMTETIAQNRVSLRNLKVAEFASEDTLCFSAIVLFDGKPIARAKNEGRGGCTFIDPLEGTAQRLAEAEAFARSLPAVTAEYADAEGPRPFTIEMDLEYLVDHLASEMNLRTAFNRDISNKTLFIKDGRLVYLKGVRLSKVTDQRGLFRQLRKEHGAEVILAELPREEAFVLWKKHSESGGKR